MMISEIQCKSILTKSKVFGIDYTICPYIGCVHQCLYCYVRFMEFVRGEWGQFLYVKANAPEVLRKQILKVKRKSKISISTATDPYQPAEKRYEITRKILKELSPFELSISILTKSALITRDMNIIKDMREVEVGFSITTTDEQARKIFESHTSSIKERFWALEILRNAGIKTYVFIAPILPYFTENSLPDLTRKLKDCGVTRVIIDKLNYIKNLQLWEKIKKYYPELTLKYKNIDYKHFDRVKELMIKCCKEHNLTYETCF